MLIKNRRLYLIFYSLLMFAGVVSATPFKTDLQIGYAIGAGINYYTAEDNYISVSNASHASFAWDLHIATYFNRYIGIQLGYLTYGFYENSGDGYAFCDRTGNCDYSKPDLAQLVFKSHLTVRNDISIKSAYVVMLLRQPIAGWMSLYEKLGISYTWANIDSYVTVDPEVFNIGPTFQQYDPIGEHQHYQPFLAFGWTVNLTHSLAVTTEFDWNGSINMFDHRGRNGQLHPMAIMVGMNYSL